MSGIGDWVISPAPSRLQLERFSFVVTRRFVKFLRAYLTMSIS